MSIYYCPGCGSFIVYGKLEVLYKQTRLLTLKMIKEGKIKADEQKFCFICEKRREQSKEKIVSSQSVVNSCVECFDLQIDGMWQGFTPEQRGNLRKAFLSGSLYFNGEAILECPSCIERKAFMRDGKCLQ